MTKNEEEFMKHYNSSSRDINNLIGLFNELYWIDGEHEMDNSWTGYNWYEISNDIQDRDFYIFGVAPAPYPCCKLRRLYVFLQLHHFQQLSLQQDYVTYS